MLILSNKASGTSSNTIFLCVFLKTSIQLTKYLNFTFVKGS